MWRLPVAVATDPVDDDADDPAIWVNRRDPARSLVIGTNKAAAPRGALVTFDLEGRVRQVVRGLDRPNNVDVEYDVAASEGSIDIAVVTERYRRRLRVFRVSAEGQLEQIGAPKVFAGEPGERGAPMGVALYRRPRDGAVFAVVSRKEGPTRGYLWQYRLEIDDGGEARLEKVRELGLTEAGAEVEAVLVDDERGVIYYSEEESAIHAWRADPDHVDAGRELYRLGEGMFYGDREGLALYAPASGPGYVLATDQIVGGSRYLVFERGSDAKPSLLQILVGGADETDGLDATAEPLGEAFPRGLVVAMNSRDRNFLLYRWEDLAVASQR
jgi:3-phytase